MRWWPPAELLLFASRDPELATIYKDFVSKVTTPVREAIRLIRPKGRADDDAVIDAQTFVAGTFIEGLASAPSLVTNSSRAQSISNATCMP